MRHLRRQSGDTLVEVVMAAAILSVVMATSFNIANLSFRLGVQARERSEAVRLVQEQAERLHLYRDNLAKTYADVPTTKIFTNAFFANCATECWFDPNTAVNAATPPTDCSAPGACKQDRYHVGIKLAGPLTGADSIQPIINVSWQSILGGVANNSQVKLFLVDNRAIQPRDCSVAGQAECQ